MTRTPPPTDARAALVRALSDFGSGHDAKDHGPGCSWCACAQAAALIAADGKRIAKLEAALYGDPDCSHENASTKSKRCTSCPDCGHLLEIID